MHGPIGTPVTGWCGDPSDPRAALTMTTETVIADGPNLLLCGEPFTLQIEGTLVQARPPTIPNASPGETVLLAPGTYTNSISCRGVTDAQYIGGPGIISTARIDPGACDISGLTISRIEFASGVPGPQLGRKGSRKNVRVIGNTIQNVHIQNGAAGNYANTVDFYFLANRISNTGNDDNNSHSIYHGGKGQNQNVEIAYNIVNGHTGGRGIQIFGHSATEEMHGLSIHHNSVLNASGNACILVSHTDGQDGIPEERAWIYDSKVDKNYCSDNQIRFRGRALGKWTANGNEAPIYSTQGGDPETWVKVTNNLGPITGNIN